MERTKKLSFIIIGLLLFLPFIKDSLAQSSYVGPQDNDNYKWILSSYKGNWGNYFSDQLGETLNNLWPLEPSSQLTTFYYDFAIWYAPPPSYVVGSDWFLTDTTIGFETTGTLLFPFDNTTMTYTFVDGQASSNIQGIVTSYDRTWYIVNDTSSFLRQTFYLTLSFSPYAIMTVQFAPKIINWTIFITEFLEEMNFRGSFYKNISAIAQSDGYSLHVPIQGFDNNSEIIDIDVRYNSNGVLTSYKFLYGEKLLTYYRLDIPENPVLSPDDFNTIIYSVVFLGVIGLSIVLLRRLKKS